MRSTSFLAVAAIAWQSIASPAPKLGGRALEGGGVHLVDCRPRDTSEGSEMSWMSLVIVSSLHFVNPGGTLIEYSFVKTTKNATTSTTFRRPEISAS